MSEQISSTAVSELLQWIRQLRDPSRGCPWHRAQTFASLAPYSLEEAHEVVDAIDRAAWSELRDELGDLLLQVLLQSQLAAEAGLFDFEAVCKGLADKIQRRHPHVFDPEYQGPRPPDWGRLKAAESTAQTAVHGGLAGVPTGLPAWLQTQKLQQKAAKVGFDWQTSLQAMAKLEEEVAELRVELKAEAGLARIEDELGDVLFAAISVARHAGLEPMRALRAANRKFTARFAWMEQLSPNGGLDGLPRAELQALWQQAKQQIPSPPPVPAAEAE